MPAPIVIDTAIYQDPTMIGQSHYSLKRACFASPMKAPDESVCSHKDVVVAMHSDTRWRSLYHPALHPPKSASSARWSWSR